MGFRHKFEAQDAADRLAAELGDGWKANVWENLGWCYCIKNGGIKIHEHSAKKANFKNSRYTAYIGVDEMGGGRWAEHGDTPLEALRNTVAAATSPRELALRENIKRAQKIVKDLDHECG